METGDVQVAAAYRSASATCLSGTQDVATLRVVGQLILLGVLRSPTGAPKPYSPTGESNHSSISHSSAEARTPTPPPPAKEKSPSPKPPSNKPSSQHDSGGSMSVADLPTFTPSLYPPTAFNYERPRHFIQSQPHFQAPSYESLQQGQAAFPNGSLPKASPSSSTLSSPISTPASSMSSPRDPQPPQPLSPPGAPCGPASR
ncbi:hypothetical protein AAFF_G00059080 [Aldrovandia affinis]|uniref:Uncharacterized protein n=1 Tax=Aldrovandia affinis TaxID=143900 RepID=A0AAD7WF59_9TELE|nr:hypothetical protein AAFF_G00059080 [Aldrovandia affinis]